MTNCFKDLACLHSCIQLFMILWTIAHQDPLSMEFSRQEYWSGLPFPFLGDLPDSGIKPAISRISCIGRQILLSLGHLGMEKAMATHSSTLAWKIPWAEEPGGLQSMGSLRVGHDWATSLSLLTFMPWRRKWQPTPVFLPGESQGRGSLVGCQSLGSHRVGHDWSNLAAAAACLIYICPTMW